MSGATLAATITEIAASVNSIKTYVAMAES
jgi:hypothetical protein